MKPVLRFIVKWLLLVPFAVLVVVFSISNLHGVTLSFWPFSETVSPPVFLLVLVSLLLGFLVGAAVMWLSDGRVRQRARQEHRRVNELQRDVSTLKRERDTAREEERRARSRLPDSGPDDPTSSNVSISPPAAQ